MNCCKFQIAWVGKCRSRNNVIDGICARHQNYKCGSCGGQATHECDQTMGLVCGVPLCDDCIHTGTGMVALHGPRSVSAPVS